MRAAVAGALATVDATSARIVVALSGGRDSVALLDAVAQLVPGDRLVGAHVHHGLSPDAGQWERFCAELCARRGVAFEIERVAVAAAPRTSLEALARSARYAALAAMARRANASIVLLAHQQDDQAETLLLQLLRGAGPRGLAAMPAAYRRHDLTWLRPLLDLPRAAIDAYVAARVLAHVDDDSNAHARFRRNALRMHVVPALRALAPGYPRTLARAAAHQAEAAQLLHELAALDAAPFYDGTTLARAALTNLSVPRARNVLRWFLHEHGLPPPPAARLDELLRQVTRAAGDARVDIAHAHARLGVHRGRLIVHGDRPAAYAHEWSGAPTVGLGHGTLVFAPAVGAGIAARHLAAARVTIRAGAAGERLRVAPRGPRRAVAELLREAGVPPWDRLALPRVYCDDTLAAVPHAGVDAAFAAASGEPAVVLEWHPVSR